MVSVESRSWPVDEDARSDTVADGDGEVESERLDDGLGGARVNDNAPIKMKTAILRSDERKKGGNKEESGGERRSVVV